jgi:hypothetical protein
MFKRRKIENLIHNAEIPERLARYVFHTALADLL